ncbi:MAG TPA: hypothetical protein PKC30_14615 [Saprospiraceae bacterium]|nr:hypothetical protein [Saprospiraceae bacterium]
MKTETRQSETVIHYSDDDVFQAMRRGNHQDQVVLNWFFVWIRSYALGYLKRLYPDFEREDWDTIFSVTDEKILRRIKKGLILQEGTQLSSYYTGVARFAALDFIQDRRKTETLLVEENVRIEYPSLEEKMDHEGRAIRIRVWLQKVVDNTEQVEVLLWNARGYSFREIVEKTGYESEGACRNAHMKGRKKIAQYILDHPEARMYIEKLLKND